MKINESLKLVVPLARDESGEVSVYGYHTPISQEVFEANYRILGTTKAAIFSKGIAYASDVGPRIAAIRLKEEAQEDAVERGDVDQDGVPSVTKATAFLAELQRLTMALIPTENGWEQVPVAVAIQRGVIDKEDWSEVEGLLVFFTCGYSLALRAARKKIAPVMASIIGGLITFLPITDYLASLQKQKQEEITPTKAASSVVY